MLLERDEAARAVATLVLGVLLAVAVYPTAAPAGERSALTSPAPVRLMANEQQVAAWQVSGTCEWCIVDGQLEVRPADGLATGALGDFDWLRYKPLIKSAVFLPGVGTSTCEGMFQGCDQMTEADLSDLDGSSVTSLTDMFDGCSSLTSVDLGGLSGSSPGETANMFFGCSSLVSVDLSGINGSNINSLEGMFNSCSELVSVALPDLSDSMATSVQAMFFNCAKLADLDLADVRMPLLSNMENMFGGGCKSLTRLDLSALGATNVTDMDSLFSGCSGLERVDLSGLAGSSPKEMNYLFTGCSSIEEIDLTALDVSRAKTLNYLFYNCGKLRRLDLSSFDTSGAIQMEDMFGNDASLKEVRLGHGFSFCGAKQEPLCQLPSSVGTHLLGWRNSSGRVYAASEIPANQAETYRSGIVLDADLICLFSRYYVYDGSPVSLILTTGLAEGVDYTASYIDNVEVGTGSVTFGGINDYVGSLTFDFDISQGVPQVDAPEGIVASWGQRLSEVTLPEGWAWDNPEQVVTSSTDYVNAWATFTPEDTRNYVSVARVVRVQIDCDGSWAWDGRGWWWNSYDGTYPRSCWKRIGGSWYLFDAVGYMLDDWQSAGGSWYWLGSSGAMATGWFQVGDVWYWADVSGAMAHDRWLGGLLRHLLRRHGHQRALTASGWAPTASGCRAHRAVGLPV